MELVIVVLLIFTSPLLIAVNAATSNTMESDDLCTKQFNYFQDELNRNAGWAREMHDSWGNLPTGIFSGNLFDFGHFDQCINFMHASDAVGDVLGQHCTIMFSFDRYVSKNHVAKFMTPNRR